MMANTKQLLFVELELQHREKEYNSGGTILLPVNIAIDIIKYLKDEKHWYNESDPYDAVVLMKNHCSYIESNLLNLPLTEINLEYDIMIGFVDGASFVHSELSNGDLIILRGRNEHLATEIAILLPPKMVLTNDEFRSLSVETVISVNKKNEGRPILLLKDFDYEVDVVPSDIFRAPPYLDKGLSVA